MTFKLSQTFCPFASFESRSESLFKSFKNHFQAKKNLLRFGEAGFENLLKISDLTELAAPPLPFHMACKANHAIDDSPYRLA